MTRRFSLNKATGILAIALVLCLMIGSLAYFADRVESKASMSTVDNAIDIIPEKDPDVIPDDPDKDPDDYVDPTPNDPDDDLNNWWAYVNSVAIQNFNPADKMTLNFKMVNKGTLPVKMRETFVITSTVDMDEDNPEFDLFTSVKAGTYGGSAGDAQNNLTLSEDESNSRQLVYTTTSDLDLVASGSIDREYYVVFDGLSGNDFQGAVCAVYYLAEVMQADGDWVTAATGEITLGDTDFSVVPQA